jgi:hypothetical protein
VGIGHVFSDDLYLSVDERRTHHTQKNTDFISYVDARWIGFWIRHESVVAEKEISFNYNDFVNNSLKTSGKSIRFVFYISKFLP